MAKKRNGLEEQTGVAVAEDVRSMRDLYAEFVDIVETLPVPEDVNDRARLFVDMSQLIGARLGISYGSDLDYQRMGFRLEVVPVLRLVQTAPEAQ